MLNLCKPVLGNQLEYCNMHDDWKESKSRWSLRSRSALPKSHVLGNLRIFSSLNRNLRSHSAPHKCLVDDFKVSVVRLMEVSVLWRVWL